MISIRPVDPNQTDTLTLIAIAAKFLHALELSRQRGYKTLRLATDPYAVGFYEKMVMYKVGERRYELEGQSRTLPVMEMKL